MLTDVFILNHDFLILVGYEGTKYESDEFLSFIFLDDY